MEMAIKSLDPIAFTLSNDCMINLKILRVGSKCNQECRVDPVKSNLIRLHNRLQDHNLVSQDLSQVSNNLDLRVHSLDKLVHNLDSQDHKDLSQVDQDHQDLLDLNQVRLKLLLMTKLLKDQTN